MSEVAIYRAALEEIGKVGAVPGGGHGRCRCCSRAVIDCSVMCSGRKARAALDAAAKVEGLAKEEELIVRCTFALNGVNYTGDSYEDATRGIVAVLRAVDAYLRGEAP